MERHAPLTSDSQCEVFFLATRKMGLPMPQAFLNIFPFFFPFQFPLSKLELALEKLKEKIPKSGDIRQVFRAADAGFMKKMDYNTFR